MAMVAGKNITKLHFLQSFHGGVLWLKRQNVFFYSVFKKCVATAAGKHLTQNNTIFIGELLPVNVLTELRS